MVVGFMPDNSFLTSFQLRKEKEEYNVAELKVQINRLEDALAAETKRRVDATTKLDAVAREEVYEMEKRLRKQLDEDNGKLERRMEKIDTRLEELEERWKKDSAAQMDTISEKSTDLRSAMEQIQQEQDTERRARLKREGKLLEQIAGLDDKVDQQEHNRFNEQADFQRRVDLELETLRRELEEEVKERQEQDDEIVAALNRYTQQLQQSLSILSSD
jgi:chromosome segregation ATPase